MSEIETKMNMVKILVIDSQEYLLLEIDVDKGKDIQPTTTIRQQRVETIVGSRVTLNKDFTVHYKS